MKYIVITAKHHDGFALFPSKHSSFDIEDATPCTFEPLDLLYEECEKQGIGLGFYYSHVIDWYDGWCGEGGWPGSDPARRNRGKENPMNHWDPSDNTRARYLKEKAYPQVQELLDRYPNLHALWFDYWFKAKYINPPESYWFYKIAYDSQPRCLVNSRVGHGLGDYITAPDNKILESGQAKYWETPGTLNNTWGYSKYDNDWKSEEELIYLMVNIVSRGGNYLLNIGPKPDGSIPEGTTAGFAAIGRWMKINSEAVYGSKAWQVTHEGPAGGPTNGTTAREKEGFSATISSEDFWFTATEDAVFAIALKRPEDGSVVIKSVTPDRVGKVAKVSLLGFGEVTGWRISERGLALSLPEVDLDTMGFVLKIEASGD